MCYNSKIFDMIRHLEHNFALISANALLAYSALLQVEIVEW